MKKKYLLVSILLIGLILIFIKTFRPLGIIILASTIILLVFRSVLFINDEEYKKLKEKRKKDAITEDLVIVVKKEEDEEKEKDKDKEKEKEKQKYKDKINKDNRLEITIKTAKNKKNEDKIIEITVVKIKEEKKEKVVKELVKQDLKNETLTLNINKIPKVVYKDAKDESTVAEIIKKEFKETFSTPVSIISTTKKETPAKVISSFITANNISKNPSIITKKEEKKIRLTPKEKVITTYIKKNVIKEEKAEVKKDKDGYINVIGTRNSFKLKIKPKKKYVVLKKEEVKDVELPKEECNSHENSISNVRVVFNKLKDLLLLKHIFIKRLRTSEVKEKIKNNYKANISNDKIDKVVKEQEEKERIKKRKQLNEINDYIYYAKELHKKKDYRKEYLLLKEGIDKFQGKGISIYNLIVRKNNLIKYIKMQEKAEKEKKDKQLKKELKQNNGQN